MKKSLLHSSTSKGNLQHLQASPTVSVVMPLYHTQPEHLAASIESILSQTFTDFEFLILNDSPDNQQIEQLVQSFDDPRIVYFKNEVNLGISKARNKLLALAKGRYIAIFDHDDISLPKRLEKQVEFLNANPLVGCVSCNVKWFPKQYTTKHPEHSMAIKKEMMLHNAFAHTAMMVRKSVLQESGVRYEERYSPAEDYMFIIRLMDHTLLHNLQEVFVHYRWHEQNTTNRQEEKMGDAVIRVRCIAQRLYPLLCERERHEGSNAEIRPIKIRWLRLFFFIPIIKIRHNEDFLRYYLFGLIPLLAIRTRR